MTVEERVRPVMAFGFTERQARFLATVMLHGGVCLQRHYCRSAGLVHGVKTRTFFHDLVANGYATAYPCARNGAHVYHVHHKGLYAAVGEPNNRNRRAVSLSRAIESLMVLDRVLAAPDVTWLATENDKVAHFTQTTRLQKPDLPQLVFGSDGEQTVRYFPDKLPIGVHPDRRTHEFVYVVNRDVPVDFRAYLYRHATVLRMVPAWVIRLLVPRHLEEASLAFQRACEEELGVRLASSTLAELRWFFQERRARAMNAAHAIDEDRYRKARRAFGSVRYRVLYRHWLRIGDPLLQALDSPVLPDALARGAGRIESDVITRRYYHLAPMVGTA
jgi:hypothetical protein